MQSVCREGGAFEILSTSINSFAVTAINRFKVPALLLALLIEPMISLLSGR